ncbi:MAG: hypothetical protein ACETWM_20620 [Candidatus Lokiarchaeia archaeon]
MSSSTSVVQAKKPQIATETGRRAPELVPSRKGGSHQAAYVGEGFGPLGGRFAVMDIFPSLLFDASLLLLFLTTSLLIAVILARKALI